MQGSGQVDFGGATAGRGNDYMQGRRLLEQRSLDPHAVIIERRRRPGFIVASKRGHAQ